MTTPGNARQEKSEMHADDCTDAMMHGREHAGGPLATASGRARRPPSIGLRISAATNEIVHPRPSPPAATEAQPARSRAERDRRLTPARVAMLRISNCSRHLIISGWKPMVTYANLC